MDADDLVSFSFKKKQDLVLLEIGRHRNTAKPFLPYEVGTGEEKTLSSVELSCSYYGDCCVFMRSSQNMSGTNQSSALGEPLGSTPASLQSLVAAG